MISRSSVHQDVLAERPPGPPPSGAKRGRRGPGANRSRVSPGVAALASLLLPGLGQALAGRRERGLAVFGGTLGILLTLWWYDAPFVRALLALPAGGDLPQPGLWWLLPPFWAFQAWDAWRVAGRRKTRTGWLLLLGLLPVYAVGWVATDIQPGLLVENWEQVEPMLRGLLSPEIVEPATESVSARVNVLTPCDPAAASAEATLTEDEPSVAARPPCAPLGAAIEVLGAGWTPGAAVALSWRGPTGELIPLGPAKADGDGGFQVSVEIPEESIPASIRARDPERPQRQAVVARHSVETGGVVLTETMRVVLGAMAVTIALGFMATLFGALLAIPFAILGARNLMGGHLLTRAVYLAVRFIMNVVRAIEPLIWAVVFVIWVGQGPFAGVLALTVHTIAALGKLFSESIESIDEGPLEAIRATGASWLQVVRYGVLPQVVAPFTAFTVYRWDINVRMSVIIGFVGGGGIGFVLSQWILKSDWPEAGTAVLVIALVVMALDQLSSTLRERIVEGEPALRGWLRGAAAFGLGVSLVWALGALPLPLSFPDDPRTLALAALAAGAALAVLEALVRRRRPPGEGRDWLRPATALLLLLFTLWAWQVARVDLLRMARDAGKVRPIAAQLLSPDLLSRDSEALLSAAPVTVPCSLAPLDAPADEVAGAAGPPLALEAACADPGDALAFRVEGLDPDARLRLRWILPGGRRLDARTTGPLSVAPDGRLEASAEVRPLLAEAGEESGAPVLLALESALPAGPLRPSAPLRLTLSLLVVTVLMALMATTFGALLAFPLSLLGARNLMPRSLGGNALYYGARTIMNVVRAIEPLILAALFAAWVGRGSPYPGILALTVFTMANLGKLFSEAAENIEPGPQEAVAATGAGRLQAVRYAVLPQLVPPYLSFGIYHWDINVRMSTVLGFVGAGGIGFVLREWMNQTRWSWAAVAILGIVLVVTAMDLVSARVRERLV